MIIMRGYLIFLANLARASVSKFILRRVASDFSFVIYETLIVSLISFMRKWKNEINPLTAFNMVAKLGDNVEIRLPLDFPSGEVSCFG